MAKNYRSGGIDFDDLFEAGTSGTAVSGARSGGAALQYAALGGNAKRANVGYRYNGSDVSNLWLPKGAVTISRGGVPDTISRATPANPGTLVGLNAFLTFSRDGTVQWGGGGIGTAGNGNWITTPSSTIGDSYDVLLGLNSQSGDGTLTGATGAWQQISTNRQVILATSTTNDARFGTASINVQIRRRSDNVVLLSYNVNITVTISNSG